MYPVAHDRPGRLKRGTRGRAGEGREENERNGGPAPANETTAFRLRASKKEKPVQKKESYCPQGKNKISGKQEEGEESGKRVPWRESEARSHGRPTNHDTATNLVATNRPS